MPAATGDLTEFTARDLIGSAGVGANGEKLANTLLTAYPRELKAAQLKSVNAELTAKLTDADRKSAAAIAGVPTLAGLKVRGGRLNKDDAVVVYSWLDEHGQPWKGCFPYSDLGAKSSDQHSAQRDSLSASTAARDWLEAQAKNSAPAAAPAEARPFDPIADYDAMSAEDIKAYMAEYPQRAEVVKALETATQGEKARKSIMEWEPPAPEGDGQGSGS